MVSDKLKDLLSHLEAREKIAWFTTPMERLKASLYEFNDEDVAVLVRASVSAAETISGDGPYDHAISLMTIGLEIGRELERRI